MVSAFDKGIREKLPEMKFKQKLKRGRSSHAKTYIIGPPEGIVIINRDITLLIEIY